jgi:hypothetical protein
MAYPACCREAEKWFYFDKFKMILHHNKVCTYAHFLDIKKESLNRQRADAAF